MSNLKHNIKKIFKTFRKKMDKKPNNINKSFAIGTDDLCKRKKKPSFLKNVINLAHRFACIFVRFLLDYFYGKGKSMPPIKDLTLLESATSLACKIRNKKLTSVNVCKSFIERIKEVNPLLNCVVDERFNEALKEAAEADAIIASGKYTEEELAEKKPFLGVPITTKDCIMVKGLLNTAGLYRRRNFRAEEDAECVSLMKAAGAIFIALTNVSECCMWWESINPVHGRTNNPYDTHRIVGGSSGGEGTIQAAAASPFGIGSDIGGSIRMPAFFNGVFGHKPSRFTVSNIGQHPTPFSRDQDSFLGIGPMCRFAVDLNPMLKIMSGQNAPKLRLDDPVNLQNVRFFYQESDGGGTIISPVDADLLQALRKVVKHIETGIKVKPKKVQLPRFKKSSAIWLANMADDSGIGFDGQLANMDGKINAYTELLKWFVGCSNHTLVGLLTCIAEYNGVHHGTSKYNYLVQERDRLISEMKEMLGDDGVFLYPTHPTVAPYHNEPLARTLNFSYTAIINVCGFPATAIPLGLGSEGLPLGIQVVANHNQDRLCLAVAAELERAFGGWVAPPIIA